MQALLHTRRSRAMTSPTSAPKYLDLHFPRDLQAIRRIRYLPLLCGVHTPLSPTNSNLQSLNPSNPTIHFSCTSNSLSFSDCQTYSSAFASPQSVRCTSISLVQRTLGTCSLEKCLMRPFRCGYPCQPFNCRDNGLRGYKGCDLLDSLNVVVVIVSMIRAIILA